MNTTTQYRRTTALAAVLLALLLPMTACQTPPPRNAMQIENPGPTPSPKTGPLPMPPAEAPAGPSWRERVRTQCAERLVNDGIASLESAKAYCTGESVLLPY